MRHSATADSNIVLTPILFLIILSLTTLAHVSADMYVPSLPAITQALATDSSTIQLTLSFYMLGFGLSQLIYGPLSDRIGRRKPIVFGVLLGVMGGMICALAPVAAVLIVGRFIQGVGIGVSNCVGRSLTRDVLSGTQLAKIGSHISMVNAVFLAMAPTLGGYIQTFIGWRATFIILVLYAFAVWMLVYYKLPETNLNLNPDATKLNVMIRNYLILLRNKAFIGFTLCSGLAYAGLVAYLTVAPFLLQNIVGLTPVQFGWLAFLVAGSIFLSAFINSKLIVAKGIPAMMFYGACLMITAGILMLALALCGFLNTVVVMLPVAFFSMGAGLTFANAFAAAFHEFPHMAGSAGALFGCIQILTGGLVSAIMAAVHATTQLPLAVILVVLGVAALFFLRLATRFIK
jgi:DHA1 family 2-module integral membrane pump EmrD-like MFS transporter